MKKYFTIVLLLITQTPAAQDSIGIRYPAPAYVQQTEAWLGSRNAAGLLLTPVQKVSMAEVFAGKGDGGFVNYYQSDNSYEWGAGAESYYRLNPRVVLYGKMRYTNFTGQNMTGSAFIDPDYNAFDLSEMADSTRGAKNRETFLLSGGAAAQLGHGFSLGGQVDYRTANYAKYRDLRHTNKLLDLTASAGVNYQIPAGGDAWALIVGGCYLYRRSVEGLSFNMYGVTDKQYYTLINFGGFYGNSELWSASGSKSYTIDSKPMFNEFNGGAIQLNWRLQNGWNVFGEAIYLNRTGYYGKQSPNTYVFTNHNGTETTVNGTVAYSRAENRHSLSLQAGTEHLENYELISHEDTQGSRTNIIYTGSNRVLNRDETTFKADYTGSFGVRNFCPAWQIQAGGEYGNRDRHISLYPYYRLQTIWNYKVYARASRRFWNGNNQYGITLGARYGAGGGTPKDDRTYAPPSSQQKPPKSLDPLLYQEYEYLTAPRWAVHTTLEYARNVNPAVCAYVHLNCDVTYATKTEYITQKTYTFVSLSAGCRF
ncbi:MAG: hypothetical protein LBB64_00210 [Dysgonamonadaceae bacterium]|jgi:hypothetical protein|nr:hypothetical protein [Dysgonamonadaceae bacterium]